MSRLADLLRQTQGAAIPATSAIRRSDSNPNSRSSDNSNEGSQDSQLPTDLEIRIRVMARRWRYSNDELAEVLELASADPFRWLLAVNLDERTFGIGEEWPLQ